MFVIEHMRVIGSLLTKLTAGLIFLSVIIRISYLGSYFDPAVVPVVPAPHDLPTASWPNVASAHDGSDESKSSTSVPESTAAPAAPGSKHVESSGNSSSGITDADGCNDLRAQIRDRIFSRSDHTRYCSMNCTFNRFICCDPHSGSLFNYTFMESFRGLVKTRLSNDDFDVQDVMPRPATHVLEAFLTVFLPYIAIFLLCCWRLRSPRMSTGFLVFLALIIFAYLLYGAYPYGMLLSHIALIVAVLVTPGNSEANRIIIMGQFALLCALGGCLTADSVTFQLSLVGVIVVLVFFAVIGSKTRIITNNGNLAFLVFFNLFAVSTAISHAIGTTGHSNIPSVLVSLIYKASIISGDDKFWFTNGFGHAGDLVRTLKELNYSISVDHLCFYILFTFFLPLVVRMLIGVAMMKAHITGFDAELIWYGLYVYGADIFSPFERLWVLSGRIVRGDSRAIAIGLRDLLLISMTYSELTRAWEIAAYRFVALMFKLCVMQDNRLADITYAGVLLSSFRVTFKCAKSMPWHSARIWNAAANNTKVLTSGNQKGVGLMVKTGLGLEIITVEHVLAGAPYTFGGVHVVARTSNVGIPETYDPIRRISVVNPDSFPALGMTIKPCLFSETSRVKFGIAVLPGQQAAFVTELHFNKSGGINAHTDNDYGDSGGPLFGVLDDGEIRFLGVVSTGYAGGIGNVYSSAVVADGHDPLWLAHRRNVKELPYKELRDPHRQQVLDRIVEIVRTNWQRNHLELLPKLAMNDSIVEKADLKKSLNIARLSIQSANKVLEAYEEAKNVVCTIGHDGEIHCDFAKPESPSELFTSLDGE